MPTFLFLNQFLCCDHELESSPRDDSNEWSQHKIWLRLMEILLKMLSVGHLYSKVLHLYEVKGYWLYNCLLVITAL